MKILVVNHNYKKIKGISGGKVFSEEFGNLLIKCFGKENVVIYEVVENIGPRIKSYFYNLLGYCAGLMPKNINDLKKITEGNIFNYAIITYSKFGLLTKYFNDINLPVITYFQNVEIVAHNLASQQFSLIKKILYYPVLLAVYFADKNALRYSKKIITLSKRDSDTLKKIYGRGSDFIFPIIFGDRFNINIAKQYDIHDKNKILFVGSDFYGNTIGLFWFIENCLNYINAELLVVGSGMDKYNSKYPDKKVSFIGYVDDIAEYYYQVNAVVLPIMYGSGMKTKTCEALMYGKTIFGTTETFQGYDNVDCKDQKWLCNSTDDFIVNINNYLLEKKSRINYYSRDVFLKYYSPMVFENRIFNIFRN